MRSRCTQQSRTSQVRKAEGTVCDLFHEWHAQEDDSGRHNVVKWEVCVLPLPRSHSAVTIPDRTIFAETPSGPGEQFAAHNSL